jgi:hypothetical protein
MRMREKSGCRRILAAALAAAGLGGTAPAQTQDQTGDKTSAGGFLWQGNGLKLETAPLPRDQVVAFLLARGFDSETAKFIAGDGCIFRSAIGGSDAVDESGRVSLNLSDWRIITDGSQRSLRTRQKWALALQDRQIDPGAAIALEWALFPTEQSFGPGDYNWGLLSFALPPGTRFDLAFSWAYLGAGFEGRFRNMECAQ